MNQEHSKRGRQSQGRGNNAWGNDEYNQQSFSSGSPVPEGVYSNPHVAHALTSLVGCVVEVKMQSGVVYEGILRAISPHMDIALKVAHDKSKPPSRENIKKILELQFQDVVTVSAAADRNPSFNSKDIFKTDTEISRSNGPSFERDLQPFTDFTDHAPSLDDESGTGWSPEEMYRVNREKFQVTSSFDENMTQYTTALHHDGTEEFEVRAARAAKLAREIDGKGKSKQGFDDIGTEEERFSLVVRQGASIIRTNPTPTSNAYAPPPIITTTSSTQDTTNLNNNATPTSGNQKESVEDEITVHSLYTETLPTASTVLPQSPNITSSVADVPSPSVAMVPCQPEHESSTVTVADQGVQDSTLLEGNKSNIEKGQIERDVSVGVVKHVPVEGDNPVPVSEVVEKNEDETVLEKVPEVVPPPPPQTEKVDTPELLEGKDNTPNPPQKTSAKFKLNPNAKEFVIPSGFCPSSPTPVTVASTPTSASTSPTVSTAPSSIRTSPSSTYHPPSGGGRRSYKQPRQPRTVTPTHNYIPQDIALVQTTPVSGGAGFVIPQPGVGLPGVRPVLQQSFPTVIPGGQVLYPVNYPYQFSTNQTGVMSPYNSPLQQVVSSGAHAKFNTEPNAQQQIMLSQQLAASFTPAQQQQILQQQAQQAFAQQQLLIQQQAAAANQLQQAGTIIPSGLTVSGAQAQLQAFPNQIRYAAQPHLGGHLMFNVAPQGGVAMAGGATPIPVSGGGVPLQNIHSTTQPALLSGSGVTPTQQLPQAQVFNPNRLGGYSAHTHNVGK